MIRRVITIVLITFLLENLQNWLQVFYLSNQLIVGIYFQAILLVLAIIISGLISIRVDGIRQRQLLLEVFIASVLITLLHILFGFMQMVNGWFSFFTSLGVFIEVHVVAKKYINILGYLFVRSAVYFIFLNLGMYIRKIFLLIKIIRVTRNDKNPKLL